MRMFLVGMCDIFLILYLTTLTQTNQLPVSSITVEEYHQLAQEEDELSRRKAELEEALAKLESDHAAAIAALSAREEQQQRLEQERESARGDAEVLEERLAALETERTQALEQAAALRGEVDAARERVAAQERERRELEALASSRQEALREAAEALRTVKSEAAREQRAQESLRERLAAEEAQAAKELAMLKAELEEARRSADEAAKAADEARTEAERALERADISQREREEALAKAAQAEQNRVLARRAAEAARREAEHATETARSEAARAQAARTQAEAVRQEISEILQPAEQAYLETIHTNLRTISIRARFDTLLGSGREKTELTAAPASIKGTPMLFIPLSATVLRTLEDADDLERLEITVDGARARWLYVSPDAPHLLAVPDPGGKTAPGGIALPQMPTLLAVRGDSALGLLDRVRDVRSDYFVFRRDQLRRRNPRTLVYDAQGIRGTGDYAQYIREGDQIVDLSGNVIGVASARNTIRLVQDPSGWRRIDLFGAEAAREAGRAISALDKSPQ